MPSRLRRHDEPGDIHFVTVSTFRRLPFFRHPGVCGAFVEGMKLVRDRRPIRWIGYVIMPEHVHFAVLPQRLSDQPPVPISLVLQELKSLSGRLCKGALREVWRACHTLGSGRLDAWATERPPSARLPTVRGGPPPQAVGHPVPQAVGHPVPAVGAPALGLGDPESGRVVSPTASGGAPSTASRGTPGPSAGERPFWKPRGYDFNVHMETTLLEKLNYMHANPLRRGLVERAEDWLWSSYRFYELGDRSIMAMDWDGRLPLL